MIVLSRRAGSGYSMGSWWQCLIIRSKALNLSSDVSIREALPDPITLLYFKLQRPPDLISSQSMSISKLTLGFFWRISSFCPSVAEWNKSAPFSYYNIISRFSRLYNLVFIIIFAVYAFPVYLRSCELRTSISFHVHSYNFDHFDQIEYSW
jgi:hypothetical protein